MNGDFSRDTSERARLERFTRVLLQQGRPLLDADFNEQSAIHHHFLRTLIVDLMGRGWRPAPDGFSIPTAAPAKGGFKITKGHLYVDGILCENVGECTYEVQPFLPNPDPLPAESFIAYIECWERHRCAVQQPELREIALGGPDTASRAQIVWQVRAATAAWVEAQAEKVGAALGERIKIVGGDAKVALTDLQKSLLGPSSTTKALLDEIKKNAPVAAEVSAKSQAWFDALTGVPPRLRAMAKREASDNEACTISPDSRYRGRENQLYRVEIHRGGTVVAGDKPTFKWSRENGSVLFAVRVGENINVQPNENGTVTLDIPVETLGHDRRTGLCVGDWVEVTSGDFELDGLAPPLGQVKQIDRTRRTVVVEMVEDKSTNFDGCTLLRRWDQTEHLDAHGTVPITEASVTTAPWTPLERGVQIQFQTGGVYRTGDYWLVPARAASGNVLWAQLDKQPAFIAPDGIARHRAAIGHRTKT